MLHARAQVLHWEDFRWQNVCTLSQHAADAPQTAYIAWSKGCCSPHGMAGHSVELQVERQQVSPNTLLVTGLEVQDAMNLSSSLSWPRAAKAEERANDLTFNCSSACLHPPEVYDSWDLCHLLCWQCLASFSGRLRLLCRHACIGKLALGLPRSYSTLCEPKLTK